MGDCASKRDRDQSEDLTGVHGKSASIKEDIIDSNVKPGGAEPEEEQSPVAAIEVDDIEGHDGSGRTYRKTPMSAKGAKSGGMLKCFAGVCGGGKQGKLLKEKPPPQVVLEFAPGSLGMRADWHTSCPTVFFVAATGQAKSLGVKIGWIVHAINGEQYTEALLDSKTEGSTKYEITFICLEPNEVVHNAARKAEDEEQN